MCKEPFFFFQLRLSVLMRNLFLNCSAGFLSFFFPLSYTKATKSVLVSWLGTTFLTVLFSFFLPFVFFNLFWQFFLKMSYFFVILCFFPPSLSPSFFSVLYAQLYDDCLWQMTIDDYMTIVYDRKKKKRKAHCQ